MADRSKIEWTDASWNPIRGVKGRWFCTKISEGCQNCYAERLNLRFGGPEYKHGADRLRLDAEALTQPLRWKRPRRIFIASMTDAFGEWVDDEWLDKIFAVAALASHHTFQVLTKRAERMQSYVTNRYAVVLPDPNIWLGVSVENQARADERIPWLLKTPAAVRFLSVEPLLGPVDLKFGCCPSCGKPRKDRIAESCGYCEGGAWPGIQWVITGGESGGPPERALVERESWSGQGGMKYGPWEPKKEALEWVRALRDQCAAAGVPFFHKQWGGPTPKSAGRLLDGRTWDEMPA